MSMRFTSILQSALGGGILFVAMFGLLTHYSGDTYPLWKQAVMAAVGIVVGLGAAVRTRP